MGSSNVVLPSLVVDENIEHAAAGFCRIYKCLFKQILLFTMK